MIKKISGSTEDEQIIEALESISLLRTCKRLSRVKVLNVLEQVEEVINFLIVTNAYDTATALKVAELQQAQLSRLKESNRKIAGITSHVSGHMVGNA